jgi:hypothetical protein
MIAPLIEPEVRYDHESRGLRAARRSAAAMLLEPIRQNSRTAARPRGSNLLLFALAASAIALAGSWIAWGPWWKPRRS